MITTLRQIVCTSKGPGKAIWLQTGKMTVQKTFFLLTLLLLFSCGREEKAERNIVQAIQQSGKLVTAEYSLSKMVKARDNQTWYKIGDRRILISTEASVKAGVDLQTLSAEDVAISEESIRVNLPAAQIFSVSIPPEKIRVLYQDVSVFRSKFTAAERESLLRQAEAQVRSVADSLGILQTAQKNAALFIRNLLQQGGYKTITIDFKK
ncbi:MAG: DUF4230 domain-containing protein [Chitinophagaceae bacterium]|nr:MAG: DUF4230 domain-containing protein [Chitinophagaceae bacterium]